MQIATETTYPTLLAWREAKGLNQRDAAHILRISQNYYSRIERGLSSPRGEILKFIRKKTGVPLDVLVGAA